MPDCCPVVRLDRLDVQGVDALDGPDLSGTIRELSRGRRVGIDAAVEHFHLKVRTSETAVLPHPGRRRCLDDPVNVLRD